MRRPAAGLLALAALAAACLAQVARAGGDGETPAARPGTHAEKTFLIPSGDGYGVGECLTAPDSACGQVVANAWCEAQGFAAASGYGVAAADEYTGAIDQPAVVKAAERPIRIICQD